MPDHDKLQPRCAQALLACCVAAWPGPAPAAGGHHAVDDAALLDPGHCQVETWFERARSGGRRLWHVGPACRVGPVELAVNVDRNAVSGEPAVTERFRDGGGNYWRGGVRYVHGPALSVDLSYARSLRGAASAWWALGVTWEFGR